MEKPETILIADDDQVVAQLLAADLTARGFKVIQALDGMQAVMAIRRSQPAAVILDALMPGGTGLDVLKRIRGLSHEAPTRILAVSASDDPGLQQQMREAGADEFLRKPLDTEEVYRILCRLLGKSEAPEGPPAAPASTAAAPSSQWGQFSEVVLKRVAVLEQAAAAWQKNTLTADLQQRAEIEAHRLSGSLGMLGFPDGSSAAQEIEKLLTDRALLRQSHPTHLATLVAALRKTLPGSAA